jgi:hypothetical protein
MSLRSSILHRSPVAALLLAGTSGLLAQTPPLTPDVPPQFDEPLAGADYERRGERSRCATRVKLFTVVVVPRGAKGAPMI